jgi:hypothetical protein
MKGLSVSIYENKEYGSSSNNGISKHCKSCIITSKDFVISELFKATEDSPEVVIIKRDGRMYQDVIAVPRAVLESGKHYMFGGSFIYSSDSRFNAISKLPIKLFDRVEG